MSEINRKRLKDILQKDGNNQCADCGAPDPEWASHNLGIFLCVQCCSIHRSLGAHISKVKSIKIDNWDERQVQVMEDIGNKPANAKVLKYVPICYRRPTKDTPQVLREQWIRAKYERLEFMDPERQLYLRDTKVGYLWKKGREDAKFQQRKFELLGRENKLNYYIKENGSPKAELPIDELNCCFVPDKVGNLNGMQISYGVDRSTRNIYVYAEDGKEIVDWYMAIRNSKLTRLRIGLPHLDESELLDRLTRDFTLEGWLYKTGPKLKDGWKRRWCTLDKRKLLYYQEPLDAYAKGEIFIGHETDGYSVCTGVPQGRSDHLYSFTLKVPERQFAMAAESEEERDEWIAAIQKVLTTVLSPQDTSQFRQRLRSKN